MAYYSGKKRVEFKDKTSDPYIKYIATRLLSEYNQNWLASYVGPTGSGKSYGALATADKYYLAYKGEGYTSYVDTHVAFSAREFLEMVQDGNFEKGDILIWDEAGVGLNARQWYSVSNKAILYVLQTFRHLNLGVIFTTPTFGYLDKAVRPLFHTLVIFKGAFARVGFIRDIKTLSVAELRKVVADPYEDKIYFTRYCWKIGTSYRYVPYIYFRKPRRVLIKKYEQKKDKFSKELRKEMKETLDELSKVKTKLDPKEILDRILSNADKYFFVDDKGRWKPDVGRIMVDFKISQADARVLAKTVLRLGVGENAKVKI